MKEKLAYIGGTFEIPHIGHANLIRRVIKLGFEPVVMLNSDKFVEENRGYAPVFNQDERKAVIEQLDVNVFVVECMEDQLLFLEELEPTVVVLGSDWMKSEKEVLEQFKITREDWQIMGFGFLYLPRTDGVASADLKERLK